MEIHTSLDRQDELSFWMIESSVLPKTVVLFTALKFAL